MMWDFYNPFIQISNEELCFAIIFFPLLKAGLLFPLEFEKVKADKSLQKKKKQQNIVVEKGLHRRIKANGSKEDDLGL